MNKDVSQEPRLTKKQWKDQQMFFSTPNASLEDETSRGRKASSMLKAYFKIFERGRTFNDEYFYVPQRVPAEVWAEGLTAYGLAVIDSCFNC